MDSAGGVGRHYLIAFAIHKTVAVPAAGERGHVFKAVSPGLLPLLALLEVLGEEKIGIKQ